MLDSDTIRQRIGDRLRAARVASAITSKELATAVNVSPQAVSQWETGRTTPTPAIQLAIAKALDVPWSSIFGLDGEAA